MYYMDNLITWYMSNTLLTDLKEVNTPRIQPLIKNKMNLAYKNMEKEYFKLMPNCNLSTETHVITFEDAGTEFIKQIFKKEVDDDTLVISSKYEHEGVNKELNKCKNVLLLEYNKDFLQRGKTLQTIINTAKQYKKVFVYLIGTQISTGQITPQSFLYNLKKEFSTNKIKHIIFLDDVHGMFMVPRDYTLFDYILYTAHAIIPNFNMGVLISKTGNYGYTALDVGKEYLPKLKALLQHKETLNLFKRILIEYFSEYLANPELQLYQNTVDHIFALQTENLYFTDEQYIQLKQYGITLSEHHTQFSFIRIRFQEFLLQDSTAALEGLSLMRRTLDKALCRSRLKGEF